MELAHKNRHAATAELQWSQVLVSQDLQINKQKSEQNRNMTPD